MKVQPDTGHVLHLLLTAEKDHWQDCLRYCKATDTVVLMDAAVMGLTGPGRVSPGDFPCTVVASRPDAEARIGMSKGMHEAVCLVSDDELIGLFENHPHCLSWR